MNVPQPNKANVIIHHWAFWLLIITLIGIILRMLPSLLNAAWGVDFGIYYGLTNSFLETKEFINFYDGWGSSYQYFPVLYAITGVLHWITGIEVIHLMPKIAPIIGGLTIPVFYFITKELIGHKKIALFSSGLLAVSTFHIYQTSHAAPLTVGHFFMMVSFYFFIKYTKDQTYIIPLLISTTLLILSHHFTTYFYLISITFIVFYYSMEQRVTTKHLYHLLFYISLAATIAFGYWGLIATPVFHTFFSNKMFLPPTIIVLLFYLFIFSGVVFIRFWKQQYPHILSIRLFQNHSKERTIIIMILLIGTLSTIVSFTGLRGVKAPIAPFTIVLSIPMIVLISFGIAGFSLLKVQKGHAFVKGWIIGIFLSFLYAIVSGGLFPDRHLEYLIVPLCIPAALTFNEFINDYKDSAISHIFHDYSPAMLQTHRKKKIALIGSIIILFISNMIVAYPTIESLEHIDERVSDPCINCLEWMQGNMSNTSKIASDHRLSMLFWATGFDILIGRENITQTLWTANTSEECLEEILRLNITHVIIDDIMYNKIINVDVGYYYQFTNQSYEKFMETPFELIYRNATMTSEQIETHWIEVYRVNYTDIL